MAHIDRIELGLEAGNPDVPQGPRHGPEFYDTTTLIVPRARQWLAQCIAGDGKIPADNMDCPSLQTSNEHVACQRPETLTLLSNDGPLASY
jgi:hypothetical protein